MKTKYFFIKFLTMSYVSQLQFILCSKLNFVVHINVMGSRLKTSFVFKLRIHDLLNDAHYIASNARIIDE
jgi:hypothetical protein